MSKPTPPTPPPPRELWTLRFVPMEHPRKVSDRLHQLLAHASYHAGLRVHRVSTELAYADKTLTVTAAVVTFGAPGGHDAVVPPIALRVRKTIKYALRQLALRCVSHGVEGQTVDRGLENPPGSRATSGAGFRGQQGLNDEK